MLYSRFSLFIYFIHSINSVCISIPISQFIFPHPPWYPYICSLCPCLYFCLQIISSIPFFFKPHGSASGKEPLFQCRRCKRCGFYPWVGQSPGGGHVNSLQYSCLENPIDRGAWRTTVHGLTQCRTWLKWLPHSKYVKALFKEASSCPHWMLLWECGCL